MLDLNPALPSAFSLSFISGFQRGPLGGSSGSPAKLASIYFYYNSIRIQHNDRVDYFFANCFHTHPLLKIKSHHGAQNLMKRAALHKRRHLYNITG